MATGVNGSAWLSREHAPVLRLLLFAITMIESFLSAWAFAWFIQVAIPTLLRTSFKTARFWKDVPSGEIKAEETNTSPWS